MIKSLCVFTLLVLTTLNATAWWVRVGNGGEGILSNGSVYIRDLYEANTHLNPYVDDKVSNYVENRWGHSPVRSVFSGFSGLEQTLLKKLSELDEIQPGLAAVLIQGLEDYEFAFTTEELTVNSDPSAQVPGDLRVGLATRQYRKIYLQKNYWDQLSKESQAALILHEIFYAFSEVRCRKVYCFQDATQIRPLIGQLFKKEKPSNYRADLIAVLGLSKLSNYCADQRFSIQLMLNTQSVKTFNLNRNLSGLDGILQKACADVKTADDSAKKTFIFSDSFLSVDSRIYKTIFAPIEYSPRSQIALVLKDRSRLQKTSLLSHETSSCFDILKTRFTSFATYPHSQSIGANSACY